MEATPSANPLIGRTQALMEGRKFYFSGKPCRRGHVAQRYCSTGACVVCQRGHATSGNDLHRALLRQRSYGKPFLIIELETHEQKEQAKVVIAAMGWKTVEPGRPTLPEFAGAGWVPPQDLVNPQRGAGAPLVTAETQRMGVVD